MKQLSLIFLVFLLCTTWGYAVTGTVSSFYGQSNPFNITLETGVNKTIYLDIPKAWITNLTVTGQNFSTAFVSTRRDDIFNNSPYGFNTSIWQGINTYWTNNSNVTLISNHSATLTTGSGGWKLVEQAINNTAITQAYNFSIYARLNDTAAINHFLQIGIKSMDSGNFCVLGVQESEVLHNYTYYNGSNYVDTGIPIDTEWKKFTIRINTTGCDFFINTTYIGKIVTNTRATLSIGALKVTIAIYDDENISQYWVDNFTSYKEDYSMLTNFNAYVSNQIKNTDINVSYGITAMNQIVQSCSCINCTNLGDSCLVPFIYTGSTGSLISLNLSNLSYYYLLDNCTLTKNYSINYSIKDETTGSLINTATTTGTYNYTIDGINYYTYTLNEPTKNNYSICIYPSWAQITSYSNLYSSSGSEYPQRRFTGTDILTNLTTSKTLYLLNSSLGIYIRFKTTDSYNNVLTDVNIKAYKATDLTVIIEEESSDGSGMATFFLNPNQNYYFIITKTGYSTYTTTLRPTTSEIIGIILTSSGATSAISYSSGISYYYSPTDYQLEANTFYNFTFNLNSSYWDITGCTFYLSTPTNQTILTSSSSSFTTRNCNIKISFNTSNYESIVGYSIYELNHTINITETANMWNVNQYSYSNYTMMTIISDINNLVSSNVGGMSSSTLKLIVFFLIFGLVAYVSYKFQGTALTSPESIIIFIVVLVWFFSFLGWITLGLPGLNFVNAGENHTVAWLKQYLIAILLTVLGGAFVYRRYKYG
jgi:hypothetical protein